MDNLCKIQGLFIGNLNFLAKLTIHKYNKPLKNSKNIFHRSEVGSRALFNLHAHFLVHFAQILCLFFHGKSGARIHLRVSFHILNPASHITLNFAPLRIYLLLNPKILAALTAILEILARFLSAVSVIFEHDVVEDQFFFQINLIVEF